MPLDDTAPDQSLPDAALALALTEAAAEGTLMFVDATGERIDRLASLAATFAAGVEVLSLPAWDTLPYDRARPSPAVMGQRVHALARLAEQQDMPRLLLASARSLLQRVPAPSHWERAMLRLACGDAVDPEAFRTEVAGFGYRADEHVDHPGEVAMRSDQVIDIFPGDSPQPVRLKLEDGRIVAIHCFDQLTQRSTADLAELVLRPVVEADPPPEQVASQVDRIAGHGDTAGEDAEPGKLDPALLQASVFDYLKAPRVLVHPDAMQRLAEIEQDIAAAYAAALTAARADMRGASLAKPALFYWPASTVAAGLEPLRTIPPPAPVQVIPPARNLRDLAGQIGSSGRTVIAAGPAVGAVSAALKRRGVTMPPLPDWGAPGTEDSGCLDLLLSEGFAREGLRVLAAPPLAGAAAGSTPSGSLTVEEPPRLTDIVVHAEHGVCRLAGLRRVGEEERLALAFHEDTELLVPTGDFAQLWRYGSAAGHVALDRLHGEAWHKRRSEIEAEITRTAQTLAAAAAQRAATRAPVIELSGSYARIVERFRYALSPDQAAAIEAVLADLRSGRPMDRLVCGDVGFGKTEVALRAAAAAALAGYQVAIIAPTTVLARQHLDTFRRRLAGTAVRVEPLLRGAAADKAVREGLADGSIGVVVGTQAIASKTVRFARLGLVVIDEEQRFGDVDKRNLTRLRDGQGVHTLVMSATPIPRTLQASMVGLRDISVIATPPMRRQPTRTFVLPFTEATVREALRREHGRGGQSFVVAPRIEALAPLEAQLRRWLPELSIALAHGKLKPQLLEELISGFNDGQADVLLATNIIEAGLDVPLANTILITGPQHFGLAQLHQMRGRVGRGARRGLAYILTEPNVPLASPTARRLRTLETVEGLGAGVRIAVADLDARGAGELFGEQQAGHVHAIGTELYQQILARELARIEGRPAAAPRPELHLEIEGRIPEDYVPEGNLRLELYRRIARLATLAEADELEEEVTDRFGAVPPTLACLFSEARLRAWCGDNGVVRVDAGPKAVALTPAEDAATLAGRIPGSEVKGERVILHVDAGSPAERLTAILDELGKVPPAPCAAGPRGGSSVGPRAGEAPEGMRS